MSATRYIWAVVALVMMGSLLLGEHVRASDVESPDVDGFTEYFAPLTSDLFANGAQLLQSQPGRYHAQNIFAIKKIDNKDFQTNAAAVASAVQSLSEAQAYLKLSRLRMFIISTKLLANASQVDSVQSYIADNLLPAYISNFASMDQDAQRSYLGVSGRAYRSLLLGLHALVVLTHNGKGKSKLVLNHFSCLDPIEQKAFKGLILDPAVLANRTTSLIAQSIRSKVSAAVLALPAEVDWSATDAVGPVLNQGSCGSCWAFAAVEVLQSRLVVSGKGKLTALSEQQLTSCFLPNGCGGGNYETAWSYVQSNGLVSEVEYPYENAGSSQAEACVPSETTQTIVTTTPFASGFAPISTEQQMMQAVANGGPIAISIATPSCFSQYSSGVLTAAECTCYTGPSSIDHAVTIVGYGTASDGTQYWKVKNSWGANWGQGGYVLLERNAQTPQGMCGLLVDPNYPQSVSLSSSCSQSNPPAYCSQALQPIQYTNLNTTSSMGLGACVASYSGEYSTNGCVGPSSGLPIWAWVLIGIAIAIGLVLLLVLVRFCCIRYARSDAWYNVFAKPETDGYKLLSKEDNEAGRAPLPNSDPRSFPRDGRSSASEPITLATT